MKRLFTFLCIVLLAAGCDKETVKTEEPNPYKPITGLSIPREALIGEEVTFGGRGFARDCRIELQLNGAEERTALTVVSVDEASVRLEVPRTIRTGFYAVVLTQGGKSTRIGGINIAGDYYETGDFEIYVLSDEKLQVYPASVSKQVIDITPLPGSGTKVLDNSGYVEAMPDGWLYYTSFGTYVIDGWIKERRSLGAYNMLTGKSISPRDIDDLFTIGRVGEDFCIMTMDSEYRIYTLSKWTPAGKEDIKTFDFSVHGSARILVPDQKFVYYPEENVILIYGNMGTGESMAQSTFTLDIATGEAIRTGNDANHRYCYAVAGEDLYCFATKLDDGDVVETKILHIDNVREWSVGGTGATLVTTLPGSGFMSPVYSPLTGKIYGADSSSSFDVVMTFDPQTGTVEGKKWIKPGIAGMFYASAPENETEN